ncbi:MAG: GTP-binding protein [Bacillota bacterium]
MEQSKEILNIVVVGHVDHGKSTLIGKLLYDTDSLPEGAVDKVKRISKEKGKDFEYAYLLDAFEEEQKQGITIDTTQLRFSTEKRDYVIIDAPGHKEFLKNMISGAANAEAAFLLIDANEGIQEQSRRHGYILSLLGIEKVYVIVNKMDLVNYDQGRFQQIQREFNIFLNGLNIYPQEYIPISAFYGENVSMESPKMPWYRGKCILKSMDFIEKEKGIEEKPLRFPIQDVYKFDHRRIIAGRIESGTLRVGDEIVILPSNKVTKVKSIECWNHHGKLDRVSAGMSVGITVEDEFFNKRGEIISHRKDSVLTGNLFNANLFWMGKNDLVRDKKYTLKLATQEVECEIFSIDRIIDASTLEETDQSHVVKRNDVAKVTIKTKQMVCFDEFSSLQNTGRFVIVDGYDVSGGGIITGIEDSLKNREIVTKSINISPRKRLVSRKDRENAYDQRGTVIWLTGLPGCGKNEIAVKLEKKLFDLGKRVYYLDSANMRFGLSSDLEFTEGDAHEQTRRIAEVANLFADSGTITIVTSVGRFKQDREFAKKVIGEDQYIEVLVEATEEVCKRRSPSGIYDGDDKQFYYEKSDYPVIMLYVDHWEINSDKIAESLVNLIQ